MPEPQPRSDQHFVVRLDHPLIGVLIQENGHEAVVYLTDDSQAESVLQQAAPHQPIKLAGVWRDLDTADALDELDRIRHQSRPTPPITEL